MKQKLINIYEFKELSTEVQNKVIEDEIEYTLEDTRQGFTAYEGVEKAIKKSEKLHTPWFLGQYVFDYCKEELYKSVGKYYYREDGKVEEEKIVTEE